MGQYTLKAVTFRIRPTHTTSRYDVRPTPWRRCDDERHKASASFHATHDRIQVVSKPPLRAAKAAISRAAGRYAAVLGFFDDETQSDGGPGALFFTLLPGVR